VTEEFTGQIALQSNTRGFVSTADYSATLVLRLL